MRGLAVSLVLAGCSSDTYMIVTIDARPAVHNAASLDITQKNAGSMRTDTLALGSHAFPTTFSISAPGRAGELDLQIDAHDTNGLLVASGASTTTVDETTADVMLEPADFVVNTDFADDQFLTTDFETNGFQLGATTDGNWTVAYRSTCTDSCTVFGRRFDSNGVAVSTVVAAGTNGFPISTTTTQEGSFPAIAGAGTSTVAVWDFMDTSDTGVGVACRGLDATGTATAGQLAISTDAADTVTIAPLTNGNFAVSWQIYLPSDEIRTIIAKPDCSTVSVNPITASTLVGTSSGPHRSSIAANGAAVLYAWLTDDDVRVRPASNAAAFSAAESVLVAHDANFLAESVRVAPMDVGFAVVVRWAAADGTSPGKIELFRTNAAGGLMMGAPTLVTNQCGSEFGSGYQGFGVTTRADGAILIVWHQCADGSAGACDGLHDVYGRIVRSTGLPVGDPFPIATTTAADQLAPSVVAITDAFAAAWTDSSQTAPDISGTSVRARVLYPPYDDATAILGAPCGGSLPACGTGLACAMGTDSSQHCHATCSPPTCDAGGTCSPIDSMTYACTF